MTKKYSLRVPLHASPIPNLSSISKRTGIHISVYGGVPDSPLNGGRFNIALNGLVIQDRFFLNVTQKQLDMARADFYDILEQANQNNLSFYIAFTNMFVGQEELNEENLYPVKRLVGSSEKYGVKNGLILHNRLLEDHIRQRYGNRLFYSSSCTKYVSPDRILTPKETVALYLADSGKYDSICVTPQDSRRESVLKAVLRDSQSDILAISNSYCANNCNSYYHYRDMSRKNKKSILDIGTMELVADALFFLLPRITTCSALRLAFCKLPTMEIAAMQLRAGVVNFKLGRGSGEKTVDELADLIAQFRDAQAE